MEKNEQIIQVALEIDKGREDPVYFAENFLGMELYPEQKIWLSNSNKPINILDPGNRWGKSAMIAVKHIWFHFYQKTGEGLNREEMGQYMTCNLAPHSEVAKVVWEYVWRITLGEFSYFSPREEKMVKNKSKIAYFYDSRIEKPFPQVTFSSESGKSLFLARSTSEDKGSSVQGKSFAYISYDECCRSNALKYEIESNILPRVSDYNGMVDLLSTPDQESKSIYDYYSLCQTAEKDHERYYLQHGSVFENIFLPPESRDKIDQDNQGELREQIISGKFIFAASTVFTYDEVEQIFDNTLSYSDAEKGHNYAMGIDLAAGEDHTVIYILDVTAVPYRIVRKTRFKGRERPPQAQFQIIRNAFYDYSVLKTLPDWYDRKQVLMEEGEYNEAKIAEVAQQSGKVQTAMDATGMGGVYAQSYLSDILDAPPSLACMEQCPGHL